MNPENERIKRKYLEWQREASSKGEATIRHIRNAICRFETFTKYKSFKTFNKDQAIGFKKRLSESINKKTRRPIAKSTVLSTLNSVKDFFAWLKLQSGYRSKIKLDLIEYFNLPESDIRQAMSPSIKAIPSIEQIKEVIFKMPINDDIQKRDRAMIALGLVSGMRVQAMATLKLNDINLDDQVIYQYPQNGVKTKFSKSFVTAFFPVGNEITEILKDWIKYLKQVLLFGESDPIFPRTKVESDENKSFKAVGVEPLPWKTTNQFREVYKRAFENAGIKYFNPHSFRNTLTRLGHKMCKNPEQYKAWSQNFGHENPATTFCVYGKIPDYQQVDIIRDMTNDKNKI